MSNRVQTLPPTLGVKDPEVRSFLDALANAWDHRNGITDKESPDRFITAEEIKGFASQAVVETLGSAIGVVGAPGTGSRGPGSVGDIISAISDDIKKSLLYQILGTPYANINLDDLRRQISASVDQAAALFAQERQSRLTAEEATTYQLSVQLSRIAQSEAAITLETQTRANKDNALAAAINNIWAAIGGNTAVIQDGALAQVSPSGSQALRWTQVQSEVIDPNTGQSRVASIRQDFSAFSDKVNNRFGSLYTVRAQITSNGRTVVGGFGLSAIDGPGGPTIDFGVRADTFWVAGLDGTETIPFIIKNNKVYIQTAMIANASIDTAKIADAAITNAKIGNAEIDTLKIQGEAITKTRYNTTFITSDISASNVYIVAVNMDIPSSAGVTNVVISGVTTMYPKDNHAVNLQLGIRVNGSELRVVANTFQGGGITTTIVQGVSLWPGSNIIQLTARLLPGEFKSQVGIIGDLIVQSGFR